MTTYPCHYCGHYFIKEGEEIYMITNLILGRSTSSNYLHWMWVGSNHDIKEARFYFHRKCFKKVAGQQFLAKEK